MVSASIIAYRLIANNIFVYPYKRIMNAADLFKSLSEPVRLRILYLLSNTEPELCVCDLVDVLEVPQGTISRHLTHLRLSGLVEDRREGVWVYYRLASPASSIHEAILQVLKHNLSDQPDLAADLIRFADLKKKNSLACCSPQDLQGRRAAMRNNRGEG